MNISHNACICEEMVDPTDKKLLVFGKIRLSNTGSIDDWNDSFRWTFKYSLNLLNFDWNTK